MSEIMNAERKPKRVQIYDYDGGKSCFTVDELDDKIVSLKKLCEGHTDCYIELQGGYDGEWGLTLYKFLIHSFLANGPRASRLANTALVNSLQSPAVVNWPK